MSSVFHGIASIFGGRTKRDARLDAGFEKAFDPLISQQSSNAGYAAGEARGSLGKASELLSPAADFWKAVSSGDKGKIQALVAPQMQQLEEGSAARQRAAAEFAPRGGRRTERLNNLSDDEAKTFHSYVLGLKPEAMSQLTNLAQLLFGAGTSELGASTGAGNSGLQALLGGRGLNLQERGMRYDAAGRLVNTLIGAFV